MNEKTAITARKICHCGHLEGRHAKDGSGVLVCTVNRCMHCHPHGSFTKSRGDETYGFEFSGYEPQAPTIEEFEEHGTQKSMERHPAYAQIGASRVSGGAYLYGSDFRHQHYITIQIHESELQRQLSGDWPMAHRRIIEVAMSEAQWATFVSSLNQGGGVQCTIDYEIHDGVLPAITPPKDRRTQFSQEMQEHFDLAQKSLTELGALIDAAPLSEKKKDEIRSKLNTASANIGRNTDFVADQFDEHMERTVEKAKSEVNAYAQHTLVGLASQVALTGGVNSPLLLEAPEEDES